MIRRHAIAVAVLVVGMTAACGSSGGDADESTSDDEQGQDADEASDTEQPDDTEAGEGGDDGSDSDDGSDDDGDGSDGGDGSNGEQPETETTPGEVGTVVTGRAVATVSGSPEDRDQQSGDVTHDNGEDCEGEDSLSGLEEGAAVTILDASSGEVVGTGTIESTFAVEINASAGNPPLWECSFDIRATLTGTPDAVRVQVADLEPWDVTGTPTDFQIAVPVDGSTGTTEPFVDTTPPAAGSVPPTGVITSPST